MGKHLRYEQRCQIYALDQQGVTQEAIAQKINSTQPVVSRELKRNRGRRGYRFKQAQAKADERRHVANAAPSKMTPDVIAVAKHLDAGFYFAKPYHAWERGLNENTNGLVRQYFPKGSSFANVTAEDVGRVQNLLNSRPRKTLGFQSPNEVFFALKSPPPNG